MKLDRESRQTVAQFLNGLAVTMVGALILAPFAVGTMRWGIALAAIFGASICHALALYAARR